MRACMDACSVAISQTCVRDSMFLRIPAPFDPLSLPPPAVPLPAFSLRLCIVGNVSSRAKCHNVAPMGRQRATSVLQICHPSVHSPSFSLLLFAPLGVFCRFTPPRCIRDTLHELVPRTIVCLRPLTCFASSCHLPFPPFPPSFICIPVKRKDWGGGKCGDIQGNVERACVRGQSFEEAHILSVSGLLSP